MLAKTKKTFDCVEMKRTAQEELHTEYEARKNEFPSYYAFLEAKTTESAWQKEFWDTVATARRQAD
jgi:hypothetical protein